MRIMHTSIFAQLLMAKDPNHREFVQDQLLRYKSSKQAMESQCKTKKTQRISSVFTTNQCRLILKSDSKLKCKLVQLSTRVKETRPVNRMHSP